MGKFKSIAIDGPSGAGKSTIARTIAARIGYTYLDTGAIYRAVGLYVKSRNVNSEDEPGIKQILGDMNLKIVVENGLQSVFLNGIDVSREIRQPEISIYASNVSKFSCVRDFLLETQRSFSRNNNVIMDGRDIGTVVLPNADIKIFLTADVAERARRRYEELSQSGNESSYEDVIADMTRRDKNDSGRKIAPLKPADNAIIIDTTGNTLEKSLDIIYNKIKELLHDI